MRNVAVLIVVLWPALPPALGQQPYREIGAQTLATARLSPGVRKNIERVIFDFVAVEPRERSAIATQIPFGRVSLGPQGHWVWQAEAPHDFCGSHSKCEHWLFDPATGASLADDVLGTELNVLDTRHNGWRDFMTNGNVSVCENIKVYYQFDGHKYRSVRSVSDKSTCDSDGP